MIPQRLRTSVAVLALLAGFPVLAASTVGSYLPPPVLRAMSYQQAWMDDMTQFKVMTKSRQIGITFVETLSIVMRLLSVPQKWYYLSASEARSAEAMSYAAAHCLVLTAVMPDVKEEWLDLQGIRYKRLTITLPNGSQLIGLPANARTARGCSGNLTLDEFAWHIDAALIWQAVAAFSTWGYHIHIISTPNGQQGEFYRIWTSNEKWAVEDVEEQVRLCRQLGDEWSRHLVNVYDAKLAGHPVDIDKAREIAGTEENWQQEYLCRFLDEATAWLTYRLIEGATSAKATTWWDSAIPPSGPMWAGFDVGRKRDLSVIWINEQRGPVHWTRGVITMKATKFIDQKKTLWDVMREGKVRRLAIDTNGIGAQLGEEAEEYWGETRVEQCNLTIDLWAILAAKIKKHLEQKTFLVPDCPEVRRDLHMVRRVYTDAGKTRFEAPRTKEGHADRFVAGALALHAADDAAPSIIAGGGESDLSRGNLTTRDWSGF